MANTKASIPPISARQTANQETKSGQIRSAVKAKTNGLNGKTAAFNIGDDSSRSRASTHVNESRPNPAGATVATINPSKTARTSRRLTLCASAAIELEANPTAIERVWKKKSVSAMTM